MGNVPRPNFDSDEIQRGRMQRLLWNGDSDLSARIDHGPIDLHRPRRFRDAFPSWLELGMFANVDTAIAPTAER